MCASCSVRGEPSRFFPSSSRVSVVETARVQTTLDKEQDALGVRERRYETVPTRPSRLTRMCVAPSILRRRRSSITWASYFRRKETLRQHSRSTAAR
jgi:hypothetical protein